MASYDSADLLNRFDELAARPATDEITDLSKYARLAQAQMEVIGEIAGIYPDALYQAPTALTADADRKVFSFGTDAQGHAVAPYGHVGVYSALTHIPDSPLQEGVDYLNEGTQIRIPNDRTWGGTLYGRWIPTPADISSSQEPALRPAPARILIVLKAVENFANEGAQMPQLAQVMADRYAREFTKWMLILKTQFSRGGAVSRSTLDHAVANQ